jgi:hypothetical protein
LSNRAEYASTGSMSHSTSMHEHFKRRTNSKSNGLVCYLSVRYLRKIGALPPKMVSRGLIVRFDLGPDCLLRELEFELNVAPTAQ